MINGREIGIVFYRFKSSRSILATFVSSTISIMLTRDGYAVFDSHARNFRGDVDPNGSSVL